MGCFESKTKKNKAKSIKTPKIIPEQNNIKWKRLLQNSVVQRLIIEDITGTADHPAYKAIDKDVSRTFPGEQFFAKESNIALFKETLKCFALTFPKVGYTQGLNFLTGYLLLNKMSKIESLKILVNIMAHPSLMMLGLYEDDFPLAHLYCEMFWKLLRKMDTQLYNCLKLIGLPDHMWIFQWYLTFFMYSFPRQYVSFFLNEIFEHKEFEMVLISVGIVVSMRNEILNMPTKDDISLLELLQNLKYIEFFMKIFNLEQSIKKARSIDKNSVKESLDQIKKQQKLNNFYVQYFYSQQQHRKSLYEKFILEVESTHEQLSNSKNNEKLMESYKRNRETVQILDEIMILSYKRRMYSSNIMEYEKNRVDKKLSFKKWKSLAHLAEESQEEKEGETTVSIVKKVVIQQDKNE